MTSKEYGDRTNAMRDRTEKYIARLMKSYFSYQLADLRNKIQYGFDGRIFSDWEKWDAVLFDRVEPKVRTAIKAGFDNANAYIGTESSIDVALLVATRDVMRRLEKVNDTTRAEIEKVMAEIDPNKRTLSVSDAIAKLGLLFSMWMKGRAAAIGLTLGTASINSGTALAMDNAGVEMKRWRAFIDADTRPAHAQADGQEVLEREMFEVGGELLRWPGDPFGSPGNIINCRCYVEPVV